MSEAAPNLYQRIAKAAQDIDVAVAELAGETPELHAARVRDIARDAIVVHGLHLRISQAGKPWIQFSDKYAFASFPAQGTLSLADAADAEAPRESVTTTGFAAHHQAATAARAARADAESAILAAFFGQHDAPPGPSGLTQRLSQAALQHRDTVMTTMTAEDAHHLLDAMQFRLGAVEPTEGAAEQLIADAYERHGVNKSRPKQLDLATCWFDLETTYIRWKAEAAQRTA